MYSDTLNPFGIQNDRLVTINDVPAGLSCECVCPKCKSPLIARKGPENIHHFAHYRTKHCEGSLETALHIKAKHIFENHDYIVLPPVPGQCADPRTARVVRHYLDVRRNAMVTSYEKPSNNMKYEGVFIESKLGKIIPDVILQAEEPFIVEIYVTNKTSFEKIRYIKEDLKLFAVEIDLRWLRRLDLTDETLIKNAVIGCPHHKTWLSYW